ncbi:MAG: TM0996/MTH895 family glutaredoxin-like protein [candidate division NC10 bacterium]|nr:TM0996/MTH895 family glutaredoxin-like protein [candidate division NC10 bacterium]MBI2562419.1 TM0996/MTH895 family glutaredoxin-like protein [candidate division NC10 bacterium]
MNIEVFGPGCARCQATKDAILQAVEHAGVEATLTHVSDPREIAKNRVFFTPAVRIDGEMKSTGRVPKVEEITDWLREKAAA